MPRVRFQYGSSLNKIGVVWERIQLLVRLSFAITINNSQEQTLKKVGLYFAEHDVFNHGQLYTALSHFTSADSVKILCNISHIGQVKNIVLSNVLNSKKNAELLNFTQNNVVATGQFNSNCRMF